MARGKHAANSSGIGFAVVAAVIACAAGAAHARGSQTFSVFHSANLSREIHGGRRDVDLSAGPLRLGDASAFFGVDSLSNDAIHYLTSGLQWKSGQAGRPRFAVGAMHTSARGASIGSQTLMRAEARLGLGKRWYLPDLTLETDQLSSQDSQSGGLAGRAMRLGLSDNLARGGYRLTYFQSSRDYNPWGSVVTAGDRGLALTGRYDLGRRWHLRNTIRVHNGGIRTGIGHGLVYRWQLSESRSPTDWGRPWRLTAQVGHAGSASAVHQTPLSLEISSRTRHWRDWHIDSGLGWYQGGVATPYAMPIDGGLWRVSASRSVNLGVIRARVRPSLSIGGSRYAGQAVGTRAGLAMGFPGLLDSVDLNVDYLSNGWGPSPGQADVRMSLSVRQNAGAIVPRLKSLVDRLRAGGL